MPAKNSNAANGSHSSPDFSSYASAYTDEINKLLEHVSGPVDLATIEFINRFYRELTNKSTTARILGRLSPSEYSHLRRKQAEHLRRLLSPKRLLQEHYEHARFVGRIHAMVGVGLPELMSTYHLYQAEIKRILADDPTHGLNAHEQEQINQALHLRLMLDMESQIVAYSAVDIELAAATLHCDQSLRDIDNLQDLLNIVIRELTCVDGIAGCLFLRADKQGALQVEASDDKLGRQYADSLDQHDALHMETIGERANAKGPSGRAWGNGEILANDSFATNPHMQPWAEAAKKVGFRSSAAVPLVDDSGDPFALLALYSTWPGFFSDERRLSFLRQLQRILSHAIPRLEQGTVIPERTRRAYRRRLAQGGMRLLYQPIIDLRTGELRHVEALARLYAADGSIIPPNEFLPAFGKTDLLRLFETGTSQLSRDLRQWQQSAGLNLSAGINLPTEGLINEGYRDVLFKAIDAGDLSPAQLRLELLETIDTADHQSVHSRLEEFRQAGIALVQDDLGSGHSSLLRMDRIKFDEIKIDQGLIRNAISEPQHALEFIYHLTRLAHGFGVKVTVEGLENWGLIEAAAILGADSGQGYGIAHPMPPEDLPAWADQWSFPLDTSNPRTALGALAGYLLWDQQLASYDGKPDLIEDLIRSPSVVLRYLSINDLHHSPIQALVENNLSCALRGRKSAMYKHTRKELIRQLSERWKVERSGVSAT